MKYILVLIALVLFLPSGLKAADSLSSATATASTEEYSPSIIRPVVSFRTALGFSMEGYGGVALQLFNGGLQIRAEAGAAVLLIGNGASKWPSAALDLTVRPGMSWLYLTTGVRFIYGNVGPDMGVGVSVLNSDRSSNRHPTDAYLELNVTKLGDFFLPRIGTVVTF